MVSHDLLLVFLLTKVSHLIACVQESFFLLMSLRGVDAGSHILCDYV